MPIETLRSGSRGTSVFVLQAQLNLAGTDPGPLQLDGRFGPLTDAAVRDFQDSAGLTIDGTVGPLTWAALATVPGLETPVPPGLICDNGNPAQQGQIVSITAALRGMGETAAIAATTSAQGSARSFAGAPVPVGAGFGAGAAPGQASITLPGGMTLFPLVGSRHEDLARSVYLGSLNYDTIFFTSQRGAQGRAFTIAVPVPPLVVDALVFGGVIQVLNLGPAPSSSTVVHELGHAWQSQHGGSATAYIANCLACQGAAAAANTALAEMIDPSIKSNKDWPANFPFSPYAYRPGKAFSAYGGEQIAEQIENSEAPIRSHVTAQPANVRDVDNDSSLAGTNIRFEDRRAAGVKF